MLDPHGQILEIIRKSSLDPTTVQIIESAFHDAHRLTVIRDAFMEEKDALAVKMIRDMDSRGPEFRELLPMSMGPNPNDTIFPGQSAQITARPQRGPFRPTHLLVARECAGMFDINDIRVGNRSQTAQAGDVPADAFANTDADIFDMATDADGFVTIKIDKRAEERMPIHIDFEMCQTAMDICLVVTNIGTVSKRFRAAMIGVRPERDLVTSANPFYSSLLPGLDNEVDPGG
jgi:hypothetical protein